MRVLAECREGLAECITRLGYHWFLRIGMMRFPETKKTSYTPLVIPVSKGPAVRLVIELLGGGSNV